MKERKHYLVLACSVLARECYACAAVSDNIIDVRILEQGLHDIGEEKMSASLQQELDRVDPEKYDAILMGYGLCNNGIRGLTSSLPLVIPKAHDCITILMGSKEEYRKYFDSNPGTFYKSLGWIERAKNNLLNPDSVTSLLGIKTYEDYVKEYGEENAAFIMESLGGEDGLNHYSKMTYIDTRIGNASGYKNQTRQEAEEEGWEYEEYEGNTRIILEMMNGNWDDAMFLVVEPGKTIEPSYDQEVIKEKE